MFVERPTDWDRAGSRTHAAGHRGELRADETHLGVWDSRDRRPDCGVRWRAWRRRISLLHGHTRLLGKGQSLHRLADIRPARHDRARQHHGHHADLRRLRIWNRGHRLRRQGRWACLARRRTTRQRGRNGRDKSAVRRERAHLVVPRSAPIDGPLSGDVLEAHPFPGQGLGRRHRGQAHDYFQAAIDAFAMKDGSTDMDGYLAGWHWGPVEDRAGAPEDVVEALISELTESNPRSKLLNPE
ncbi:MAG: hypothetical protein E6H95_04615 [Chloroflexi bacterium]|nr:MAG: hypothetical protein E6H95_04615 [Chloroflexota bacterium]